MASMLSAEYKAYTLTFIRPSGTSRGILYEKPSFFIQLRKGNNNGVGECGLLPGLSLEADQGYEEKLREVIDRFPSEGPALLAELKAYPSIRFGLEMALRDLASSSPFHLFPSDFTAGKSRQSINGLVWMGDIDFMRDQLGKRLEEGFTCIKLKIGAIDFEQEIGLLKKIRQEFRPEEIEIRVDANGAFVPKKAMEKLKRLSDFDLHSIEQPIRQGQWQEMARLCADTPLPIALDEELIPVIERAEKKQLLDTIRPQYVIFKPSLIGGFESCEEWIELSSSYGTGWWVTSALESNIGLNAIAQWTYTLDNPMPQGLGTGSLYTNNFPSPLFVAKGEIGYDPNQAWDLNLLTKHD